MVAAQLPTGMVTYSISRLHINEPPYYDTVSRNDGNNHASKDGQRTDRNSLSRHVRGYGGKGHGVHADDFVLTHMTGMHQSKQEYIKAITNGTLNYFSAEHEQMEIKVSGNHATLTGRSRVTAAVFGGGRHTWHLQLTFQLVKRNGQWMFTNARASTY